MEFRKREIRTSQAISPNGVGAILEIRGESFVQMDVDANRYNFEELPDVASIAQAWGVSGLITPPKLQDSHFSASKSRRLDFFRFPTWLFCGKCRSMFKWKSEDEKTGFPPTCQSCRSNPELSPMRWVLVCQDGHLDDVPWVRMVHSRGSQSCDGKILRFEEGKSQGGASLAAQRISCATCNSSVNMQEIYSNVSRFTCSGRQPWQRRGTCTAKVQITPKASSAVYTAEIRTALDIYGDAEKIPDWVTLEQATVDIILDALVDGDLDFASRAIAKLASKIGVEVEVVSTVLDSIVAKQNHELNGVPLENLEWNLITEKPQLRQANLVTSPVELKNKITTGLLKQVIKIEKLREIRALYGFRRGSGGQSKLVAPWPDGKLNGKYPAIEVFGEGIFFVLKSEVLEEYSKQAEAITRAALLESRRSKTPRAAWTPSSTPQFIALHTLAHMMIKALSQHAGYDASSMREKIYCGEDKSMHGFMIYTAAGDTEGSLGGLSRMANDITLASVLVGIFGEAEWCALDPVCSECDAQGVDGLNLASCHACSLVPETSCAYGNVFLDRMSISSSNFGLFSKVLAGDFEVSY